MPSKAVNRAISVVNQYERRVKARESSPPHIYLVADWASKALVEIRCPHEDGEHIAANCRECIKRIISIAIDCEKNCFPWPDNDYIKDAVINMRAAVGRRKVPARRRRKKPDPCSDIGNRKKTQPRASMSL